MKEFTKEQKELFQRAREMLNAFAFETTHNAAHKKWVRN